jgi:hypothetical protein
MMKYVLFLSMIVSASCVVIHDTFDDSQIQKIKIYEKNIVENYLPAIYSKEVLSYMTSFEIHKSIHNPIYNSMGKIEGYLYSHAFPKHADIHISYEALNPIKTIHHEMGHLMSKIILYKNIDDIAENIDTFSKINKIYNEDHCTECDKYNKKVFISYLASTSYSEEFAELWAFIQMNKSNELKKYPPLVYTKMANLCELLEKYKFAKCKNKF